MSFPHDAGGTFEGRLGCPSELVLDRWASGELSPRSTAELEAHLVGCEVCGRRMALRRSSFAAEPRLDPAVVLSRIQSGLAAPASPSTDSDLPSSTGLSGSPAGVAAAPLRPRLRRHAWLLLIPICAALGALVVRWFLLRP